MSRNSAKSRSLNRASKQVLKSPSADHKRYKSLPMPIVQERLSTPSINNQTSVRYDNVKTLKGASTNNSGASTTRQGEPGKLTTTNASRFSLKSSPSHIHQTPFIAPHETKEENEERQKSRTSSFGSAKCSLPEEKDNVLPSPHVKISVSAASDQQIDKSVKKKPRFSSFNKHELEHLEKRFKKLETSNNSGTLSVDEFMRIPQLQKNPLVSRIIKIFDSSHNGQINFREFVQALSLFSSTTDSTAKLKFAFKMYDVDGDGLISNGELFQVLHLMIGYNLQATELQQIVDKAIIYGDKDDDGKISFPEFCSMLGEVGNKY